MNEQKEKHLSEGLNPLKRVNSILTFVDGEDFSEPVHPESQSPQAGQFNSYMDGSSS